MTRGRWLAVGLLAVVVAGVLVLLAKHRAKPPVAINPPALKPATTRATQPATATAPAPKVLTTYIDVVRAAYPRLPATQPLDTPVETKQAGYILLDNPVFLCSRKDLWITHPLGRPIEQVMKTAVQDRDHILREQVVYVHWILEDAKWQPQVVVAGAASGRFDLVTSDGRRTPLPERPYRWDAAFSWIKSVVVPTADGVAILDPSPAGIVEHFQELPAGPSPEAVQVVLDWRGVVAWRPAAKANERAPAARYFDGRWTPVGDKWPAGLLHAWPLRGGSWLCFLHAEAGQARPEVVVLDQAVAEPKKIDAEVEKLIDQLGDDNSDVRRKAFAELTRYGPTAFDTLEKHKDDPLPAVAGAIAQLLSARSAPAIQGMRPVDGRMTVLSRQADGTSIFYLEGGLKLPDLGNAAADGEDEENKGDTIAPAYIAMGYRPMPWLQVGSASFSNHARVDFHRLSHREGMWLAADKDDGLQRYVGNAFVPVLRRSRKQFTELVGIDHDGRWLLRQSDDARPQPSTQHSALRTLIVDPRLPDPRPRLPVWIVETGEGSSGWTADNYPAMKRGENSGWAILGDGQLKPVAEKNGEAYCTRMDEMPATRPATRPTSLPATGPAVDRLLVEPDGTTWYDGVKTLTVAHPDGKVTAWPLPELADGQSPATLMKTADGLLFLANRPGRILRIRPRESTDAGSDPFILEATFLKNIPTDDIRRIWLDPAGRICIAHGECGLTILFPEGRIPPQITKLMLNTTAYDEDDE